jgi:hypothetical protein
MLPSSKEVRKMSTKELNAEFDLLEGQIKFEPRRADGRLPPLGKEVSALFNRQMAIVSELGRRADSDAAMSGDFKRGPS